MTASSPQDITQLLLNWRAGDRDALNQLLPLVYDELRRQAARYLRRERPDHTLQATALVHETYLQLVDQSQVNWQNRAHFFGAAAQAMRRILVDSARAHQAEKRGGGEAPLPLDEAIGVSDKRTAEVIALDDALQTLAQMDPRQCRVVELRYFGGLSIEETAEALGLSPATVKREWNAAKVWLHHEMKTRQ
ncbi:MAG: sigma-70 family RNA polymerase sigma factor [Blastocatellia bacterium]|nr:sigma-70 family RNA polymerase sigma factor [Blastocatellia bacterium]